MNLTDTTKILKRLLEQTEYSIEYNGKRLEDAKNESIKDSSTKMWIEANEERMIRYNEEVDALRQAIRYARRQREYEDWTNKNF
jgi:anti-sigma28 factor (negative regulator of flagellin synthesis)